MKHLFVYLNPRKSFDDRNESLFKIQIENLAVFGVKPSDIILVTNFEYECGGIKATLLEDYVYFSRRTTSQKMSVLFEMFRRDMMGDGLYWVKDLDLFQVREVKDSEIDLSGRKIGFTSYGWKNDGNKDYYSSGSMFITKESQPFINRVYGGMYYFWASADSSLNALLSDEKVGNVMFSWAKQMSNAYNLIFRGGAEWDMDSIETPIAAVHISPDPKDTQRLKQYMNPKLIELIDAYFPHDRI